MSILEYIKDIVAKRKRISMHGKHEFVLTDKFGDKKKLIYTNRIVQAGRTATGRILANLTTSTDGINYCALGTGSTGVTDSDTQLESEGARKIRGSSQNTDDTFIVSFYFTPDEGNGTWTRYGTFIDGTSSADSGSLFTHAEISLTKNSGEGLTINSEYTLYDSNDV